MNATCLEQSPTALWHRAYVAAGGTSESLVAHIDARSDYDGLAVAWGIGNKKSAAPFSQHLAAFGVAPHGLRSTSWWALDLHCCRTGT